MTGNEEKRVDESNRESLNWVKLMIREMMVRKQTGLKYLA